MLLLLWGRPFRSLENENLPILSCNPDTVHRGEGTARGWEAISKRKQGVVTIFCRMLTAWKN